jgi:hypothetical protein
VSTPAADVAVLSARDEIRRLGWIAASVGALTIVAAIAGAWMPELAPSARPRPVLHGTVGEALSIFVHNMRLLVVPLMLTAGRWTTGRTRPVGDVVLVAMVVANATTVGLALGRNRSELLPYLPHLPLEWMALSVTAGAWLSHRGQRATWRSLAPYAAAVLVLAALAAVLETFAVPHA